MILPIAFEKRMQVLLGADYDDFAASLDTPPVRGLRLNPVKGDPTALLPLLTDELGRLTPIPFARDGYTFLAEHIGASPFHHAGAIYVQEPAAMAPVAAVEIEPHWWVADLCASPGGKSTQIAARLGREGRLLSNEYTRSRVSTLCSNIERMGICHAAVTSMDVPTLSAHYAGCFDLVVVDAPCSGEGMFRKNPAATEEWKESSPAFCAARQYEILKAAARMVKAGGWMIYSTCTFAPEENEWQVARFLAEQPAFALTAPTPAVCAATVGGIAGDGGLPAAGLCDRPEYTLTPDEAALCRRFYPHTFDGEGQFVALFRHNGDEVELHLPASKPSPLSKEEKAAVEAFFRDALTPDAARALLPALCSRGGMITLSPDLPLPDRGVYAAGVNVGSAVKGRLVPHHQFFSAYGHCFAHKLELSPADKALAAYLHGDTVPAGFTGWGVVTVCGIPLGGIKAAGGVGKNHYPKGLRK